KSSKSRKTRLYSFHNRSSGASESKGIGSSVSGMRCFVESTCASVGRGCRSETARLSFRTVAREMSSQSDSLSGKHLQSGALKNLNESHIDKTGHRPRI